MFGHAAGDELLTGSPTALAAAVAAAATAYRLGGDEFCLLIPGEPCAGAARRRDRRAQREHGERFTVTTSAGSVVLPREAAERPRRADARRRAHVRRQGRRAARGRGQVREVLLQRARRERARAAPTTSRHVAGSRTRSAATWGCPSSEIDVVVRAAELHDVGKIAIPDAILHKPGPLDDDEWAFMRKHTLIGERIVAAAPALRPVAHVVRTSHERWDGGGYPDGLAGEAIPLGARIVFVCDAYDAMTSDRPYARRMSSADALAEMHRNAGAQFDPLVVEAFAEVLAEGLEDAPPPLPDSAPAESRPASPDRAAGAQPSGAPSSVIAGAS